MKSSLGEQKVHKSMNFVHDLATLALSVVVGLNPHGSIVAFSLYKSDRYISQWV